MDKAAADENREVPVEPLQRPDPVLVETAFG
jgi:hypothetical protein